MNVSFRCPNCEHTVRIALPRAEEWTCPGCGQVLPLHPPGGDDTVHACVVCGNRELYRKKDFPHWLGLSILAIACASFFLLSILYYQWVAWAILLGSAVFDGLLYLLVGDVIVCYRCDAHYRKTRPDPTHRPFELLIGERYRQERLRREELKKATPVTGTGASPGEG